MSSHPTSPRPVADLFAADGRLVAIPRRPARREALLAHLAETLFASGRVYREAEVNEALKTVHEDYPALRRYLVVGGFLARTKDGAAYHRQRTAPAPGRRDALRRVTGTAVAGLLAGYGIAIPVGAVGAHLVAVAARSPWRTGAGAALGIAAADGAYALLAVAGGTALVPLLAPVATPLRWASALVLLALAATSARAAVRAHRAGAPPDDRPATPPHRAFWTFLGITVLNPMTVLYFTALVLGGHAAAGPADGAVFVAAAFTASASWQLLLSTTGTLLGHALTTPRARLLTALASSTLIASLAVGVLV